MYMVICFVLTEYKVNSGCWDVQKRFGQDEGPGKLKFAMGVALTPNQNIAVADHRAARVLVYDIQGKHKMSLNTQQGLQSGQRSHPWQVIVSSKGTFYISDRSSSIAVFSADGKYQHRFTAVSPEGKSSDTEDTKLYGLTLDNNRHILVGGWEHKYISKHTEQGVHVGSIKVNIIPEFLAVTPNGTIIISSSNDHTAQIINQLGQVLHTLNHPAGVTDWNPRGVHCCKDIIFIANCAIASSGGGIHCYSMSADYLGCITTGMHRPMGLVITEDGNKMVVAQGRNGVVILHRK